MFTKIRDVNRAMQSLYACGAGDHPFIVVSAVCSTFAHETYIFPADQDGNVTDWLELPGSLRGAMDHDRALQGYREHVESGAA